MLPRFTFLVSDRSALFLDLGYQSIDVQSDTYGIPFRGGELLDVPRENTYYTPFGNTEQEISRAGVRSETVISSAFSLRASMSFINRNLHLTRNAGGAINPGTTVHRNRTLRQQTDVRRRCSDPDWPVWSRLSRLDSTPRSGRFEEQRHDVARCVQQLAPIDRRWVDPVIPETTIDDLFVSRRTSTEPRAEPDILYLRIRSS